MGHRNISIAFYKKETTFKESKYDSLIRWWTRSPFSHVELVIDGLWYTSSPRDGGVRSKKLKYKKEHWTLLNLNLTDEQVEDVKSFFNGEIGKKYDILGIVFSQIFFLGKDMRNEWFCSEICLAALQECGVLDDKLNPALYAPGDLMNLVLKDHTDLIEKVL